MSFHIGTTLITKFQKMAFKNPWGKGGKQADRWFENVWNHENESDLTTDEFPFIENWEIKTSGDTSSDNNCAICPVKLGIDIDDQNFSNGIELKAYISGHKEGYKYNIARMAKLIFWEYSVKEGWQKTYDGQPYKDDRGNDDEMLTPTQSAESKTNNLHYIYVEDRPATKNPPISSAYPNSIIIVVVINMEEYVQIKNSQTQSIITDPNKKKWHSKMYLKLENGQWSMDKTKSSVGEDNISETQPTD